MQALPHAGHILSYGCTSLAARLSYTSIEIDEVSVSKHAVVPIYAHGYIYI